MTPKRVQQLRRKLQESRHRLRTKFPRFAEPLQEMQFIAVKALYRMSTDGKTVYFDADWLQKLTPEALDFMLCHQLMHVLLGHIQRSAFYRGERYHLACDVIANSTLRKMGWTDERIPGVGTIYHITFFPAEEGADLSPEEAFAKIPFDPATLPESGKRKYLIDSERCWNGGTELNGQMTLILSPENEEPEDLKIHRKSGCGNHGLATDSRLPQLSTVAAQRRKLAAVDGTDPEETYLSILDGLRDAETWELHRTTPPAPVVAEPRIASGWDAEMKSSIQKVRLERDYSTQRANELLKEERIWQKVNHTCLNWRTLLDAFLQEEVCDYSFLPPDRRFLDGDFFLPEFSDTMVQPLKLLFMVDTSGSIDDGLLSMVYTEICSAIEQFNGSLTGLLGFFDTQTYQPIPFSSVNDVRDVRVYGGGGTDFSCVFRDCRKYFGDERLASIVIITDGKADFPEETVADGIPTLWLVTEESVQVPWGRCAYLSRKS